MFGAIFHLTDSIITKFAKQYVRQIQIDSLPLWKGQATIDNINLNTDGINQAIEESRGTVRIQNLTISRVSAKAPLYSPGSQPILIKIHSADLRLLFLDADTNESENNNEELNSQPPQAEASQKDPPNMQNEKNQSNNNKKDSESSEKKEEPPEPNSFISKLTSNILICIDGVFLRFDFNGFDIGLVASDLEIHILPGRTKITGNNVRGSAHNDKTDLKLNLGQLIVDIYSGNDPKTIVDISNATATISDTMESNPHIFELISPAINLHMVFEGPNITVESDSDVNLTFDLDSLPSVIDIVNAFATAEPDDSFSPLPNLNISFPSVTLNVNVNNKLGLILKIIEIQISEGKINVGSISAFLRVIDEIFQLIDDFGVTGTLTQKEKITYVTAEIDTLRILVDVQKDLLNILKSINIPKIEPKTPPESENTKEKSFKKPIFKANSIVFADIPTMKISQRVVDFMFDEPIVPILFCFDDCVQRARLQLRVWDSTFQTFVALATFEPGSSQLCTFRLPEGQMISGTRWQLIFPEPLSSFPTFIEGSTIHYQTCEKLKIGTSIKASINNIVVSLSSYDYPVAGVSISNVTANIQLQPLGITKVDARLGVSVLFTNFRNSTMSSILDIPNIALQFAQFPNIPSMLLPDNRLLDALSAFPLQESYSSLASSISVRIPSIVVNAAPSIIFDFIKFMQSFSVSEVVAYKIVNRSDVPFHYQIAGSSDIVTIKPREEKSITFKPGLVHFVKFPSFQTNVTFNAAGCYRISDTNYIDVQATSPFAFTATIMSSIQFVNKLKNPLEIDARSTSLAYVKTLQNAHDIGTTSMSIADEFKIRVRLPDATEWSDFVEIENGVSKVPILVTCDVLNMLPQCYLCSPNFSCWIKPSQRIIQCRNDAEHIVTVFTFQPLLSFKNHLDMHIITSVGTIPPRTSLFLSSLPNNQIIIESDHTIDLRLPLKKSHPLNLLIHDTPAIVDTIPSVNAIVVSPSFVFKNETNIRLIFKFSPEDNIIVEPNEIVPLSAPRDPDWLSIGIEDKEGYSWSPPIQIPATRDFTIRASTGNLILFAAITEYSILVAPKTVAINESKNTIIMKPSIRIDPDSQSQLLFWRGTSLTAAFGFSKSAGFTKPISITSNVVFKRKFVMNDPGQSLFYLTYSIQTTADPNAIVFHHDPSPPFTIINESSMNFAVYYKSNTIILTAKTTIYLPTVPDVFTFGRVGTKPFTVALQFPADSFVNDQSSPLYVRVEKRGNQTCATIAQSILPKVERVMRTYISAFIADFKIYMFDDFTDPGIANHALTLALAPLSANVMFAPGQETNVSLTLDTLEIDLLKNYEQFPSLIRKVTNSPLLTLQLSILNAYGGGIVLNHLFVDLQPFQICVEESFVRFVVAILDLIPQGNSKEPKIPTPLEPQLQATSSNSPTVKLTPIYVNKLDIKETKIILSLATQSFIHADFRNVPIYLSTYRLREEEFFDVSLVQGIASHYVSDGLAAIPTLLGSLSLIGNPVNIINQSLTAIKDFYRTAFFQGDTLLHGIGRGSVNIIRGVTMGTLESFIGLTYSLEKSIGKLRPGSSNDQENERRIGNEMARAVSGLVTMPIREFSSDGLVGLARGAGLGVLGLITVPTTAFFAILKNAGSTLLVKVSGVEATGIEDNRIDKEIKKLPTMLLDNDDDDDDDDEDDDYSDGENYGTNEI
ncbi:hypothetical protein TRFO_21364 [Tritrichomonas foetus]|uniref:Chorein N-terminal domain-containing protein n=1 Tax=Tritrichomonas foetus TaxID=1144522 RepID=A0A1J4KFE0_9EUKA|nr:hypothetical protein TRFO_21364 [Tritrichomonas foetus]|eukprot:OHT09648.1 hypothetical protein TRFO_21364 [Tritrichomonas foetus]